MLRKKMKVQTLTHFLRCSLLQHNTARLSSANLLLHTVATCPRTYPLTSDINTTNINARTITRRSFATHNQHAQHNDAHEHQHDDHHDLHGDYLDRAEVERRVLYCLSVIEKVDKSKLSLDASFADIGLDSLDTVEVIMQIEEEFQVDLYDEDAVDFLTVKEIVDHIAEFPFATSDAAH